MTVFHDADLIEIDMLPLDIRERHIQDDRDDDTSRSRSALEPEDALASRRSIEPLWIVERRAIEDAIAACDGNVNLAAGLLEVAPSTIYRKRQGWDSGA